MEHHCRRLWQGQEQVAKLEGFNVVQQTLAKMAISAKAEHDKSVIVGYTAQYALYVHENLQSAHPVGQAKFLEQPARELSNSGRLQDIIEKAYKNGASLQDSLVLGALRIQRDSQQLVPIDTGNLKGSAFTRKE